MTALLLLVLAGAPVEGPVAVLPFKNLNADAQLDWLKLGMAETLIADLKKSGKLEVVERTQVDRALTELALQGTRETDESTASHAGKLVGARTVVLGSFQRAGEALRINARFVRVETGVVVDAAKATGPVSNIFALQDDVVDKLLARPAPERPKRKRGPKVVRAFQLYAMSLAVASDAERVGYLKESLDADPEFSYAQDELNALQERMRGYSRTSNEKLADAEAAALGRISDPRTAPDARAREAAALVDELCAARRFHTLSRVAARLAAAGQAEAAGYGRFRAELGRHRFDAALAAGEAFLKAFPASLHFREVEGAMNARIAERRRREGRQKEYEADLAGLRERHPGPKLSADEQRDWDYAPCLASRWNSLFGEPMRKGCSEYLARHEQDSGDDAREKASAAHFFMVLALADQGLLEEAAAAAERLKAQTSAWDDQLAPLMADWPTDSSRDAE